MYYSLIVLTLWGTDLRGVSAWKSTCSKYDYANYIIACHATGLEPFEKMANFHFISLRLDRCGSAGSGGELSTVMPEMHGKTHVKQIGPLLFATKSRSLLVPEVPTVVLSRRKRVEMLDKMDPILMRQKVPSRERIDWNEDATVLIRFLLYLNF